VEIAMHRLPRRHRTLDRQLDLFPPPRTSTPLPAPGWDALPDRTRQAVTGLMTRLLIAHAGGMIVEPGSDGDER
jgi:hypothetical protein